MMGAYEGKRFRQQTDGAAVGVPHEGRHAAGRHEAPAAHGAHAAHAAPEAPGAHAAPASAGTHAAHAAHAARRTPASQGRGGASATPRHQALPTQGAVAPVPVRPARRQTPPAGGRPSRPRRHRPAAVVSTVFIVMGVVLLVVAGVLFVRAQLGYREAQDAYSDLTQYAVITDDEAATGGIPAVDFDALAQINPDIVGWLYIEGTNINYPVVQTDNNETYLDTLFDGRTNASGTIFMDCAGTAPGMVDEQTTLYGHHMADNSMFRKVDQAQDQDVFDTFGDAYYITRDAVFRLRPLLTAVVDASYLDARTPNFSTSEGLQDYLASLLSQASARTDDADARAAAAEQVMSLVTCSDLVIPSPARVVMVLTLEETLPAGTTAVPDDAAADAETGDAPADAAA